MTEAAPQRQHSLRELFNGLRYVIHYGIAWRVMPNDLSRSAPQRQHSLRELFNGLRSVIRYGIAWRAMPNDLPPWFAVYQQSHPC
jgi:transposase